jgi:16S rRNA (cytidine1402-2'-O)-methyltransferase
VTALSVSGLPTGRFTFEGFLPQNKKNRKAQLESLAGETRTMIFYEAPHKLLATLEDLQAAFGPERRLTVCRELTKLHEQVVRTTVAGALEQFTRQGAKGEFVLILEGAAPAKREADPDQALERVARLREQGLSLKDASAQAAEEFGLKKRVLYELSLGKFR